MSKVCMVVHSYYLRDGRVRREAETLVDAGHQVHVFCLRDRGEPRSEEHNGVRIHRLPITRKRGSKLRYIFEYGLFFALASIYLVFWQLRERFDVIYVHTLPDFLVFVGLIPRWLGARIVLDVHDLMPESFISKNMGNKRSTWMRFLYWIEHHSFRFPDHIVTIHQPYARLISQRSGRKLDDITPVMNLADDRIFGGPPVSSQPSTSRDGEFIALYSGTVAKRYGVDTAIRAVPHLVEHIPGFKLMILGEGEHKADFVQLANELGVSDYVEFLSPVPIEKVPLVMRGAHIGLSPHVNDTNFRWSFPQKVYEYAIVGLPIVASRTEVLEYYYGDAIMYVPAGDERALAEAIKFLYFHPECASEKVALAKRFVQTYTWSTERRKLLQVIASVVKKNRRL